MSNAEKLTIRTETFERWVLLRHNNTGKLIVCGQCGSKTWSSLTDASSTSGWNPAAICGLAERRIVHSSLTREGHLLICTESLRLLNLNEEI